MSGYILAGLGAVLFSTKGIFAKLAYAAGPLDVETLLAWRMILSLPIFLFIGLRHLAKHPEKREQLSTGLLVQISCIGLLGYYLSSWLDFSGLQYLTAQFERLILFTYPLFLVILGALFFKHPVSPWTLPAFLISYLGLGIIFTAKTEIPENDMLTGFLLVLAAAITFALYQLLAKTRIDVIGSRLFTSLAMSAAGIGIIVHFLFSNAITSLWLEADVFAYVALIAIFSTVIPAFLINEGLNRIGPQAVSLISNLGPVFTTILAVLILGENFGLREAIGTVLVLGGVVFFTRLDRK